MLFRSPAHFAIQHPDRLHQIIRDHPLGALVTTGPDGLDANHIPFEFDPTVGSHGVLTAHVARANPVWQQCLNGAAALRNENVQVNRIDNDALKESYIRLGDNATIVSQPPVETSLYGTEHGRPAGEAITYGKSSSMKLLS